jgi:hypothetical protein
MSLCSPTEDENSIAHTPHDVMLSAAKHLLFISGIKQILRFRLRMTFKDRHVRGPIFKEDTKSTEFAKELAEFYRGDAEDAEFGRT